MFCDRKKGGKTSFYRKKYIYFAFFWFDLTYYRRRLGFACTPCAFRRCYKYMSHAPSSGQKKTGIIAIRYMNTRVSHIHCVRKHCVQMLYTGMTQRLWQPRKKNNLKVVAIESFVRKNLSVSPKNACALLIFKWKRSKDYFVKNNFLVNIELQWITKR